MTGKYDRKGARVRQQVAHEAARILATEGQRNYRTAKEKAAHRVGASPRMGLPSNAEVEEALKSWISLYGGAEHDAHLAELRRAAVEAMKFFAEFRPKLVGPVLEGTADRYSRICLHVFSEDPDAVARFLMNHNLPFEQESRRIKWHDGEYRTMELIVLEAGGRTIELGQLHGNDARHPPPSPIDGRPQRRASLREVETLIEEAMHG